MGPQPAREHGTDGEVSPAGVSRRGETSRVGRAPASSTPGGFVAQLTRLQETAGNQAATRIARSLQRQDHGTTDAMAGQIEDLLRQLPVETPEEVNTAEQVLTMVAQGRGGAATGGVGEAAGPLGLVTAPFNVTTLVQKLQRGDYLGVAQALIAVIGDAALVVSVLTYAATQMGAITSAVSGAAMAGTVAGMIAEAAGPIGIAFAVMVGVFSIPSDVNENQWKILYIGDVSGILTSWIFDDDTISPHAELVREAPTMGYYDTDLSDAVRTARQRATQVWREHLSGHPQEIRRIRGAAGDDYRRLWRELGGALEAELQPDPDGIGVSYINRLIRGVGVRRLELRRRRRAREREERFRREGGTIRTPEGYEFVIPPAQ